MKKFVVLARNGENHYFFETNKENDIDDVIKAMKHGEANNAEVTVFVRTSKDAYEKFQHETNFQMGFHA